MTTSQTKTQAPHPQSREQPAARDEAAVPPTDEADLDALFNAQLARLPSSVGGCLREAVYTNDDETRLYRQTFVLLAETMPLAQGADWLDVKQISDLAVEEHRLNRALSSLPVLERENAIINLLLRVKEPERDDGHARTIEVEALARRVMRCEEAAFADLESQIQDAGLSLRELDDMVLIETLETRDRLSRELHRVQTRKRQLMKQLDDRHARRRREAREEATGSPHCRGASSATAPTTDDAGSIVADTDVGEAIDPSDPVPSSAATAATPHGSDVAMPPMSDDDHGRSGITSFLQNEPGGSDGQEHADGGPPLLAPAQPRPPEDIRAAVSPSGDTPMPAVTVAPQPAAAAGVASRTSDMLLSTSPLSLSRHATSVPLSPSKVFR